MQLAGKQVGNIRSELAWKFIARRCTEAGGDDASMGFGMQEGARVSSMEARSHAVTLKGGC
jgi:hypothetical protein